MSRCDSRPAQLIVPCQLSDSFSEFGAILSNQIQYVSEVHEMFLSKKVCHAR